jgi:hypothetical protein
MKNINDKSYDKWNELAAEITQVLASPWISSAIVRTWK